MEEPSGRTSNSSNLNNLLSRWSKAFREGKDIPVEELARDHPELIDELASRIAHQKNSKFNDESAHGMNGPKNEPDASLVLEPGSEPLPGFRLIGRLGEGAFGEVWSAGDNEQPHVAKYALKIVNGDRGPHLKIELEGLDQMERAKHPHVLQRYSHAVVGNSLFVIMELAEDSLDKHFEKLRKSRSLLSLCVKSVDLLYGIAEALDYLRAEKLTHQDIKPSNLLLVKGRCKLSDFGTVRPLIRSGNDKVVLATTVGKNADETSTTAYRSLEDVPLESAYRREATLYTADGGFTPRYASPERFDGKSSTSSDQYSLALTFCELVADTIPFQTKKKNDQRTERVDGRMNLDFLPEPIRLIVRMALSPTPENRFVSCVELITSLRDALLPLTKNALGMSSRSTRREKGDGHGDGNPTAVSPETISSIFSSPNRTRHGFGGFAARRLKDLSNFGERLEQLERRLLRLMASIRANVEAWQVAVFLLILALGLALVPGVILRQWVGRLTGLLAS